MTWNYNFKNGFFPSLFLLWFILMQWAFSLAFLTRIQYTKCFDIKQISENKTTNGGEEDKKGYMKFHWKWCRCGWGRTPQAGCTGGICPQIDPWALPLSFVILLACSMPQALVFLKPLPHSGSSKVDARLRTTVLTWKRAGHRHL